MNKIAKTVAVAAALAGGVTLSACSSDADVVSKNLSKAADNFEIQRRIVFYNAINDKYILVIEGRCSIGNSDEARYVSITCKTSKGNEGGSYKKHHFFKSDNTTVFSEQLESKKVSAYHYRVVFKPQQIIPDIDAKANLQDGPDSQ